MTKLKLKALALSDLHLGEPETLLYDNEENILDIAIDKIKELSQAQQNPNFDSGIEELILLGDIVDLSEAIDRKAYENTKNFLKHLLEKVTIDKIIYVPGNHDHHLWVKILYETQGNCEIEIPKLPHSVSDPPSFVKNCLPSQHPPVEVHYPFYVLDNNDQYFLFDHGHLFSITINKLSRFPLINRLLKLRKNTKEAKNLKELEEITCSFMEWIWHPKETWLTDLREKIWDWFERTMLRVKYKPRGNTFRVDCRSIYDDVLLELIQWYLLDICHLQPVDIHERDCHLVFGHTHVGGRVLKADRKFRMKGPFISVWNTGGWLVPSDRFSPDAYIFYLERTTDGLKPNFYKLVKRYEDPPVGDYDERVLWARLARRTAQT
jgi:predicted phosphodiesterase